MKACQIFAIFALFIVAQRLEAGGGSEEDKTRRDTCGELVRPKPDCGGSSEETTVAAKTTTVGQTASSDLPTVTVSTNLPTVTYGTTKNGGVCVCEETSETPEASEETEATDVTEVSDVSGVSGVSEVSTVSSSSKKPVKVPSCTLTEAMWNISLTLTYEYQIILQQWIYEVEYTILVDYEFYTEDELVVLVAYSLKNFSLTYTEIWEKISFVYIAEWGYCIDFVYVAYEIQIEITSKIVEIDISDNCELFEALRNATRGTGSESDCEDLIAELLVIFKHSSWSYAQKLAACRKVFQYYFEINIELKVLIEGCSISGYGSFESFFDVCLVYERTTTLSVVIGGSTSECVLLTELEKLYLNTSVEVSVRNQVKQFHDKIELYFNSTTDINLRLKYVSEQSYSFFELVQFDTQIVCEIKLGSWGLFFDLCFCSHICTNCGCGNPDDGSGTDATTIGETTEAVTTEAVTTEDVTTEADTTEAVTTEGAPTTQKPADCSNKNFVCEVNVNNNSTYLIDHIQQNYNSWNSSTKVGFNSYFNQIKSYSFDFTITIEERVSKCITSLTTYNKNNVYKQQVVWNITITEWSGTIGQFCQCEQ